MKSLNRLWLRILAIHSHSYLRLKISAHRQISTTDQPEEQTIKINLTIQRYSTDQSKATLQI
jgi:hypothetical protein